MGWRTEIRQFVTFVPFVVKYLKSRRARGKDLTTKGTKDTNDGEGERVLDSGSTLLLDATSSLRALTLPAQQFLSRWHLISSSELLHHVTTDCYRMG